MPFEKKTKILIVCSTKFEIKKLLKSFFYVSGNKQKLSSYKFENLSIDILISGIGIAFTSYNLTKTLCKYKYDLVINTGICGSFNKDIPVGTVVNVISDEFADFGITEADNGFNTLFEKGFISENEFPFKKGKIFSNFNNHNFSLPRVTGITVNSTSGNAKQIDLRKEKFNSDIETMEGAVVAFICLNENIDFLQIRAVSNIVEVRNINNWNISLATTNLSTSVIKILKTLG